MGPISWVIGHISPSFDSIDSFSPSSLSVLHCSLVSLKGVDVG
jgi:hypothetical protein